MDIQEIYENKEVVKTEKELGKIYLAHESSSLSDIDDEERKRIVKLLGKRKELINGMFQMTEEHRKLLEEFNEQARTTILEMRNKTIELYNAVCGVMDKKESSIYVTAGCFISDEQWHHPVERLIKSKVFEIMGNYDEEYNANYCLGVAGQPYIYDGKDLVGENELLYHKDQPYNWNEGFDPELTKGMHILYGVNMFFRNTWFAVPDLLWIRDFFPDYEVVIDSRLRDVES